MKQINIFSIVVIFAFRALTASLFAQADLEKPETVGYHFTDTKIIPHTPVKDQKQSGMCWSLGGTPFVKALF